MVEQKPKSEYTTIPIKWEQYSRWSKIFNKLRMEEKLKYQEEFINLLLDKFES
jgi:hypothetical protein